MKKIYLIGTIIGLSIITMFTSLSVFAYTVDSDLSYDSVFSSGELIPDYNGFVLIYDNFTWNDDGGLSSKYYFTYSTYHSNEIWSNLLMIQVRIKDKNTNDVLQYGELVNDSSIILLNAFYIETSGGLLDLLTNNYQVEITFLFSGDDFYGGGDLEDSFYYMQSQKLYITWSLNNINDIESKNDYYFNLGYQQGKQDGFDKGYQEGLDKGYPTGYNEARAFFGLFDNGQWYNAKTWGDLQFAKGQTSETNYFSIMFTGFFSFITLLGGIELLPGLYIWHFVVFPLVFGIIFFIIGRSGGDNNKGGKK